MKVVAACVAAAAALDCASAFVAPVVSSGFASSSLSRSSRARAPGLRMTSAVSAEAKVSQRERDERGREREDDGKGGVGVCKQVVFIVVESGHAGRESNVQ